jgi:predicted ribosome quality control (RQC) complex YloA/Tae2 family protein
MEEARPPVAYVQEASCSERVIVLKVRTVGQGPAPEETEPAARTAFVIVGAPRAGAAGAGLISSEARREIWGGRLPPGVERQRAREDALEGAQLVALGPAEAFIDQHGSARVVRAVGGRVVVTDDVVGPVATAFLVLSAAQRTSLEARGREIAEAVAADAVETYRADVLRVLDRASVRIRRRCDAIRGDLGKIQQADRIASQAQWLVAEAARAPRGATKLVVTDWSTGEAVPLEVPLDPAHSPKEQVAAMFKRAKRLRLGARIAEDRLAQADAQLSAVQSAQGQAQAATSLVALEGVLREAKKKAPRDVSLSGAESTATAGQKRGAKQGRTPYRTFFARSGTKLLVGKGAADNDKLSLHVARPHDLWLHAKDRTGAHVIVSLEKGQTCTAEDLVDAAHLAGHFSDAREEKVVDVQYTDRRYIRKPRRSPAGFVVVDREKVLVLRVEPEILRGLLEREEV